MKKVGICGHFGGGQVFLDGQTVKTKIITSELKKQLGDEEVITIDTYGGIKRIFFQLKKLYGLMAKCKNIIILPAHNSLRIFAPYLSIINRSKHCRLHYIVIGGWLPDFVKKREWLNRCLKKFDYIYVETSTMKKDLESQGYNNIVIMPNCKDLQILGEDELVYSYIEPYRLCTFSRVTEKKGIDDAVETIIAVNEEAGRTVFTLDIYGQVDEEYKEHFEALMASSPESVNYKGIIAFDQSVDVLKEYYALLFPTKFYTEGIPGTIIDAYAAGIPVISARWQSYTDVVDENIVGKGYQIGNKKELLELLYSIANEPEDMIQMKKKCIEKAMEFSVEKVIQKINRNLKG